MQLVGKVGWLIEEGGWKEAERAEEEEEQTKKKKKPNGPHAAGE